jgi:nitrogen fixation protein NifX
MQLRKLSVVEGERTVQSEAPTLRLRVAVATQDIKNVNAHFGSAKKFAVYEVTPHESRFLEAFDFETTSDESGRHVTDSDRLGPKVAALAGCNLLFCLAIGGPAAARVVGAKVHPIKLDQPQSIASVLTRVQSMMTGNAPPWLRKVFLANEQRSMNFLDEED